jgi:hypothetical protein
MNMITNFKKQLAIVLLIFLTFSLIGFPVVTFPGWKQLTKTSPHIFLAISKGIPWRIKYTNGYAITNPSRGILHSDIEIALTLKGDNPRPGSIADVKSTYWPSQDETYLIFASYFEGNSYQALDDYCFVPLGHNFSTNIVIGRTLDEQIRAILEYRYNMLSNEMNRAQTEKQRLEDFLKR